MSKNQRLYFLWDYDLTEKEVGEILHGSNETEKIWILSRILESAKLEDVWKYTTYQEVKEMFPKLRLKPPVREAWENALRVWETV
ncbi:hypothetical protein A2630_05010 [Candidatus Woesebacteria bacterium RIFCSPHIGHO2_01_FULL_44_10]|uniref:Uncharacterized protein n=1 Tax=Candidatus Woesebacteria bacterium RIFCSPLOWO2_01_FULL_44_14 TaxID=1802525 RepID=A0A1F8C350_9BACT|nr:MAG: hypothetical protein A2630_05010 [Candidatus Woesebacteria bacterium RIFCSPHIGHO2_01_FULL_44_10]OGM53712.1 MAG: hypothetical protein A3F62_03545 [Candidatus Woesebacteria bacterium RIFCSPHIGHO2_12_FULL_44_11]OGM70058.1 MAG: hypothetical protein A2975_03210 [Candidatus Woesebacteria bacterium RIFCSPLOWO2_01_FULL_44_14]